MPDRTTYAGGDDWTFPRVYNRLRSSAPRHWFAIWQSHEMPLPKYKSACIPATRGTSKALISLPGVRRGDMEQYEGVRPMQPFHRACEPVTRMNPRNIAVGILDLTTSLFLFTGVWHVIVPPGL